MPTALSPLDPNYQPVPVAPPGGLLATTVGTPLQPNPPIDPAQYEDDDVINQLNRITSGNSDYMQLARTSGLQTANKRGLLNTSLAAGASQAAAIAAAAPLAGQNASQAAQRNLTRVGAYFTGQQQAADIASREGMLQQQLRSEEGRLGRQLTSQEKMQLADITSRQQMQGVDLAAQREMQQSQIASTERLTQLNIAAESDRLGRQLTAQEEAQIRDLSAQQARQQEQLATQRELGLAGIAADIQRTQMGETGANLRANLDAATRTQLMTMQNMSQEQLATLNYYLQQDQIYAQGVGNVFANADLPAPARNQAMQLFLALKNSNINLPATLFGLNLAWGPGTPGGTPAPTAGGTPVPTGGGVPTTGGSSNVTGGGSSPVGGGGLLNFAQYDRAIA